MYTDVSISNITPTKEGIRVYLNVRIHTKIIFYASYYFYGSAG